MGPFVYEGGKLMVLNQLLLPHQSVHEHVDTIEDGWAQIREMKVRGAPAIAMVAALAVAVHVRKPAVQSAHSSAVAMSAEIDRAWEVLKTSRPTAVNLFEAAARLTALTRAAVPTAAGGAALAEVYVAAAEAMLAADVKDNRAIGSFGADFLAGAVGEARRGALRVLTHCNTGALATAGYGTALGVIRQLHERGVLEHVYCTETRPYNQGSRLTAYELVAEKIPATLVTDSMVAALMAQGSVDAVIVGADRVAANGDTANKVGTYQLAVVAAFHNVPFLVAAPYTSVDLSLASGAQIEIEQRPASEVTETRGVLKGTLEHATVSVAAPGIGVWNPGFDVTPARIITAVITERGFVRRSDDGTINMSSI